MKIYGPVLALAAGLALAADWPQFLGPTRDGVSPEAGLAASWPKGGPPRRWEHAVGEGFSGPVVAGDRLVVHHRVGDDDVVECLDAATGKGRWKVAYPSNYSDRLGRGDGPRATPLVSGDRVYTLGAAGRLLCLTLDDGKKVWERALLEDYPVRPSFFGVGTSPLLEGDRLLVNVGGKGAGVVAFDAATGKEVWKATDQEASYSSPVAATIDGVRHATFFTREGLLSLDPGTGAVRFARRWRSRMDASVNAATPLVVGDEIFLTASYGTGALLVRAKRDGVEERWKGGASLSAQFNTPLYHDGFLYGCDGRQDFGEVSLRCVEWKTGKVRWSQEQYGCVGLIRVGGDALGLREDGNLVRFALTPDGYREKARAAILGTPCRAQPALAGGRLYARDGKSLGCWNLRK